MAKALRNGVIVSDVKGVDTIDGIVKAVFRLIPDKVAGSDQAIFTITRALQLKLTARMPSTAAAAVTLQVFTYSGDEKVRAEVEVPSVSEHSFVDEYVESVIGQYSYRDAFVEDGAPALALISGAFGPRLSTKSIAAVQSAVLQAQTRYHAARDAFTALAANPVIADDPTRLVHPVKNDALAALAENNPDMTIVRQRDVESARGLAAKRWDSLVATLNSMGVIKVTIPVSCVMSDELQPAARALLGPLVSRIAVLRAAEQLEHRMVIKEG